MKVDNSYRQNLKVKIVATATSMFHKHGIKSVKMDDIANALSISKRTLYEIYDNKEDLLYEVVCTHELESRNRMKQLNESGANVMDILIGYLKDSLVELGKIEPIFLEEIRKYPNVMMQLKQTKEMRRKEAIAFFKRGVDEGYFLENVNFEILRTLSDLAMSGAMSSSLAKKYDIKELFHTFTFLFIRSIGTLKGIKVLDDFNNNIR